MSPRLRISCHSQCFVTECLAFWNWAMVITFPRSFSQKECTTSAAENILNNISNFFLLLIIYHARITVSYDIFNAETYNHFIQLQFSLKSHRRVHFRYAYLHTRCKTQWKNIPSKSKLGIAEPPGDQNQSCVIHTNDFCPDTLWGGIRNKTCRNLGPIRYMLQLQLPSRQTKHKQKKMK